MKNIILTMLFLITSAYCFGQIKFWKAENNKGIKLKKGIKVKGAYLALDTSDVKIKTKSNEVPESFIAASTIAAAIIPPLLKFGSSFLTQLTTKNEKDYSAEYSSVNVLEIDKDLDSCKIEAFLNYFVVNSVKPKDACTYSFDVKMEESMNNGNFLSITLDTVNITEDYIPSKFNKKSNFIIETFDFNVFIDATLKDDTKDKVFKTIKLGNKKIHRVIPNFPSKVLNENRLKLNNNIKFFIAKKEKKQTININKIYCTLSVGYVNPVGVTQSTLNAFLSSNGDSFSDLLSALLIESE